MNFEYKIAVLKDIPDIKALMKISIQALLSPYLTKNQLKASFESMGLDDQLIKDKTYFMIFTKETFVGCGGWSNRKTLFGSNHTPNRDESFLDPKVDSARIRAMYTHPDWARKGVGSFIMMLAEQEAKKAGFKKCELMATQAGKPLYKIHGYKIIEGILYKSLSGLTVPMMKMEKDI